MLSPSWAGDWRGGSAAWTCANSPATQANRLPYVRLAQSRKRSGFGSGGWPHSERGGHGTSTGAIRPKAAAVKMYSPMPSRNRSMVIFVRVSAPLRRPSTVLSIFLWFDDMRQLYHQPCRAYVTNLTFYAIRSGALLQDPGVQHGGPGTCPLRCR